MINHRWDKNNVCINCGLRRKMETQKLLMAISNTKPYDHYQSLRRYIYWTHEDHKTFERPDCKLQKQIKAL